MLVSTALQPMLFNVNACFVTRKYNQKNSDLLKPPVKKKQ